LRLLQAFTELFDFFPQLVFLVLMLLIFFFPQRFVFQHQRDGLFHFSQLFLHGCQLLMWEIFLCIFTV
jgi:hypothetical protein